MSEKENKTMSKCTKDDSLLDVFLIYQLNLFIRAWYAPHMMNKFKSRKCKRKKLKKKRGILKRMTTLPLKSTSIHRQSSKKSRKSDLSQLKRGKSVTKTLTSYVYLSIFSKI